MQLTFLSEVPTMIRPKNHDGIVACCSRVQSIQETPYQCIGECNIGKIGMNQLRVLSSFLNQFKITSTTRSHLLSRWR